MSIPLEDLERKNRPTIFDEMSKLPLHEKIRYVITLFQYHPKEKGAPGSTNTTSKDSTPPHTPRH